MPSGGSSGRGLAGSGLLPSAGSMFWISFGLTFAAASSATSPDRVAVVSSAPPASCVASADGVPDAGSFLAPSPEDPCELPDVSPPPQAAARARRAPVKNTQAIPRPRFGFRMFKISTSPCCPGKGTYEREGTTDLPRAAVSAYIGGGGGHALGRAPTFPTALPASLAPPPKASAGDPPASQAARNPAEKASPAPVVSSTPAGAAGSLMRFPPASA